MLGYIVWLISFKVADAVVGTVLGSCRDSTCSLLLLKMYTYLFFYSENSDGGNRYGSAPGPYKQRFFLNKLR